MQLSQNNEAQKTIYLSYNPEETEKIGQEFGLLVLKNSIRTIALYGDLGAGKTRFVKGLAKAFGIGTTVNSPTFSIVNCYQNAVGKSFYHMDAYRIKSPEEILTIGFKDYIDGGTTVIEWAENIESLLPPWTVRITFITTGENQRKIIADNY